MKVNLIVYLQLVDENDRTLFSLRKNDVYKNMFSLISGKVESHEPPMAAIIREVEEEVGVRILQKNTQFQGLSWRNSGDFTFVDIFYLSRDFKGSIVNKEKNKNERLIWFPIENYPINIVPHVKMFLTSNFRPYYNEIQNSQ